MMTGLADTIPPRESNMEFSAASPAEWLNDEHLSPTGENAREQYTELCKYMDSLGHLSFQTARLKYFLQSHHYWTLPDGYALPPHTINVCVNNMCNLKCRYCDFGQQHDETFYHKYNVVNKSQKIELPLELCKSIVDQVKWFKPIIRASFREPLLYRDILPFIEYTKQNGLPFWLLTNGFNLSRMARDLVELGLDSIRLSLDGPEKLHDEIRGVLGSYRRMMEGIKLLLEEKDKRKSGMQVGFYFTLNDFNYDKITETVEQLVDEGILEQVFVNFQWLLYTTKDMAREHNEKHAEICGGYIQESTVHTVDIFKMDLKAMSSQALDIKKRFPLEDGYRIHFRPSFEYEDLLKYRETEDFPVENPRCKVPWYNMNINPEGDVKTFHHCLLPPAGNIKNTPVMDVWNGEALRDQRVRLKEYGAYRGCSRCWGLYSLLEDKKRKLS